MTSRGEPNWRKQEVPPGIPAPRARKPTLLASWVTREVGDKDRRLWEKEERKLVGTSHRDRSRRRRRDKGGRS